MGESVDRERRPSFFGDFNFAGYDPFQVFEVHHEPCWVLKVTIERGRNITKGWAGDLVDTPDPYIRLDMPSAPSGSKKTKHLDNEVNPVWNETFQFLYDGKQKNIMEISLMDANVVYDESLATVRFNVGMLPIGVALKGTFYFNNTSEVDIVFLTHVDTRPVLRFSLTLCDEEKAFRVARREKVFQAMQELLGDRGPRDLSEVPVIAVMGSGGGFRAMTGLSGACTALVNSRIIDMVTYVAGLSGSTWYISQLYSHKDFPSKQPEQLQNELRRNVTSSWISNLFSARSMYRYISRIIEKKREGQPVSFTDFFGCLVGETLLPNRIESKLTDQRAKIQDGSIPMPLYTCLHVKKHVSAMVFHEWVEFTPYEVGMPKYGTFMRSELFGSKFYRGQLVKQHPEPPLHFLQGVWGSAFTILFSRLFCEGTEKMDPTEMMRLENREVMEENLRKNMSAQESESSDTSDSDSDSADDAGGAKRKRSKPPKDYKEKSQDTGFWASMLQSACSNATFLQTREGRAGMVHNFMRGLSLNHVYPYSPFDNASTESDTAFEGIFEEYPTDMKKLYMVDGGLTFNSPFPLMLRPQRAVDILISYDFSMRPSDSSPAFEELKLAEKWARVNHVPFPEIDEGVFDREGQKEVYVFQDPYDPHCPIIMHFILANIEFRRYKAPGVRRRTAEEKAFADFDVFDDPAVPYSTFNFTYTEKSFDRMTALMEFNTLLNVDLIKDTIATCIQRKKAFKPRRPIRMRDIRMMMNVARAAKRDLKNYCRSFDSATGHQSDDDDVEEEEESSTEDTDEEDEDEPDFNVFTSEERPEADDSSHTGANDLRLPMKSSRLKDIVARAYSQCERSRSTTPFGDDETENVGDKTNSVQVEPEESRPKAQPLHNPPLQTAASSRARRIVRQHEFHEPESPRISEERISFPEPPNINNRKLSEENVANVESCMANNTGLHTDNTKSNFSFDLSKQTNKSNVTDDSLRKLSDTDSAQNYNLPQDSTVFSQNHTKQGSPNR